MKKVLQNTFLDTLTPPINLNSLQLTFFKPIRLASKLGFHVESLSFFIYDRIGTFRSDYEIEYKYDFSNLVCML